MERSAAFATAAGGLTALAIFLGRSAGRPRLVPAALVLAAVALVLSAISGSTQLTTRTR